MSNKGVGVRNTVGSPQTEEYRLGGGDVYIASLKSSGMPKSFRRIGNCPTFTVTANSETYEHDSAQGTTPVQDASVPIRSAASIGFTLESLSAENLALFFLGEAAGYTNPGIAGFSDVVQIENADIVKLGWYQIYGSDGNPVFGLTSTNSLVLESSASSPVTLVLNTDYTLDANSGKFQLLDSTNVDTVIAAGATDGKIQATVTADASATLVDQVKGLTNTTITVAVHIDAKNAFEDGAHSYFQFHKIGLTPDGDLGLIVTEAGQASFTGQVQANAAFTNSFDVFRPLTQA